MEEKLEGKFVLKAPFTARGDQPQAIEGLVRGVNEGLRDQILLGVTGSGKTFTMASVIERIQKPTLVIAHNKTLAAQLCAEFREFFPDSAVEYFVSYYDYYQPEAYIASSDTYIEKDASINDEIDRLRQSATSALRERRDELVVASVSCIYSLGDPSEYEGMMISLRPGMKMSREELLRKLVEIQYVRNDFEFERGSFRVRGDTVEIIPASQNDRALRIEFFDEEIDRISQVDTTTGHALATLRHAAVYPASHYATSREHIDEAIGSIERDLDARCAEFEQEGRVLEAQRLRQRTQYDIEMMREIGYCTCIENYSRYFDGRKPGDAPYTLLDYFPKDFLLFIDEAHVTVPQIRAMFNGDRARKDSLVDYGFRLPSAYDNRPLRFPEFEERVHQTIYVSATPGPYELERAQNTVEQIIRPTGLLDPAISVRPAVGQVDDLIGEIKKTVAKGERVLVTTLTKKMAESLTDYMKQMEIRVRYLHSDIKTLERSQLLQGLRKGDFDVLVGINLLREGLDLPEVSLVAILDADKEGFLRSETSLVQTIGRAARNAEGRVVMYADILTESMERAIRETNRRRAIQQAYNEANGITPETIKKTVHALLSITEEAVDGEGDKALTGEEREAMIKSIEDSMMAAAQDLDFERAAALRDQLFALRGDAPMKAADTPQFKGRRHPKKKRIR